MTGACCNQPAPGVARGASCTPRSSSSHVERWSRITGIIVSDASLERTNRLVGHLLAALVVACAAVDSRAQSRAVPTPEWESKMAAVRNAGPGLVPLFVLGDVNEDGKIDEKDLALVRQLAKRTLSTLPTKAISCPAAGDLDQDGVISARDVAELTKWIRLGVTTPALSYLSALPCNFTRLLIAASPGVERGGKAHIRFMDRSLNTSNSAVTVEEGDAAIASARDGRGYEVTPGVTAKIGDLIVLKITIPRNKSYYYSLLLIRPPEALSGALPAK
jgi:hypothetical protein